MSEGSVDERELLKNGIDRENLRMIFDFYKVRTFRYALQMVGSREDAMDITQEAFLRVYLNRKRYDRGRSFSAWLFRIVRNLAVDTMRRRKVRSEIPLENDGGSLLRDRSAGGFNPEELANRDDESRLVWEALGRLGVGEREIIILKDLQDFSYKEIAECLGIPMGTVMSRLHNARKKLKEVLSSDERFVRRV